MCVGPPFVLTFGWTSQNRNKNLTIPMPAFPVPQGRRQCTLGTAAALMLGVPEHACTAPHTSIEQQLVRNGTLHHTLNIIVWE